MRWVVAMICLVLATTSPAESPVRARFVRVTTLRGTLPRCSAGGSPWSPSGRWLVVKDGFTFRLFDSMRPSDSLKTLLAVGYAVNLEVSWSPDSRWIACGFQDMSGHSTLWAIPVDGGQPIGFENTAEVRRFLWASDGYLYGWKGSAVARYPLANVQASRMAVGTGPGLRLLNLDPHAARFVPGDPPEVVELPTLGPYPSIQASFPDGRRFVVASSIIDAKGRVLATLKGPPRKDSLNLVHAFTASTVTPDNRFVAGYYTIREVRPSPNQHIDYERTLESSIFLSDTLGRLWIPLEGTSNSGEIECAPRGSWAALQSQTGLVLGKIRITP